MLKLWIAAVGFSAALSLVVAAQETAPQFVKPSTASVSAGESQRLIPGQVFIFQLRLDKAAEGYGGGEIRYQFRLVSPAKSEGPPEADQQEVSGKTELVDGQEIYDLSLPITQSMLPGKWQLVLVTLGQGVQSPLPLKGNTAFEVHASPAPIKAKVIACKSQPLKIGQNFDCQLQVEPTPNGYDGGRILYRFQLVSPYSPNNPLDGHETSILGATPLKDGQAAYKLSIPMDRTISPGTWKLVEVTLGKHAQTPVSILNDVSFDIPLALTLAFHIEAPKSVTAGQPFTFDFVVDEYPGSLSPACVVTLSGVLRQASSVGQVNANAPSVTVNPVVLSPDQKSYEISGHLAPDHPPGSWQGVMNIAATLGPSPGYMGMFWEEHNICLQPQIKGETHFTFTVEPPVGLVTPTSVAVTVNPSQIDLLRGEADHLKAKAQHLKQQLSSEDLATDQVLLRSSVQDAVSELDKTEAAYKERGMEPSYAKAVDIFFDDIRFGYGQALKTLTAGSGQARQFGPQLERVNAAQGAASPRLNPASQAVLSSILHNARAYEVVASSGVMTFNLNVYSEPKGAAISYRRTGEDYHPLDHETDWRIENLPRAVYSIRLQKPGYEDKEVPFDAVDSTSTSIDIRLDRKRGAR